MFRAKSIWLISILLLLGISPLHAQDAPLPITVAIPEFLLVGLRPALEEYDEQHPEIRLVIVSPEFPSLTEGDAETQLNQIEDYLRQTDVHVGLSLVDPVTTRAGYFLNLDIFTRADPTFDTSDFYPGMLASYQWEGGTWALPIAADIQLLYYDPQAFDEAGLEYPDGSWTVDDLREVAQQLIQNNAATTVPVNTLFSIPYLSMLGLDEPLYDQTQLEIHPTIDELEFEALFERWLLLQSEGYMTRTSDFNRPIVLGSSALLDTFAANGYQWTRIPSTFPTVQPTFASINADTAYPQEAYDFVRFLTENSAVVTTLPDLIPARRSLAQNSDFNSHQDILSLVEIAKPHTNFLFFWQIFTAYGEVVENGVDVRTALADAQARAVDDLEAASNRTDADLTVAVTEMIAADAGFRFAIASPFSLEVLPLWEAVASDFTETHPEVEQVQIVPVYTQTESSQSQADITSQVDCFYTHALANTSVSLSSLLALNPLLSVDADIDLSDFPPGVLARLTLNDLLYGFPIDIQPQVIAYNIDQLEARGIPLPQHGWTTADFEALLRLIRDNPANPPALDTRSIGDAYLLNLIASYGGVPIDFRTDPPTIVFTSERSVSAIRQVLDLQKDGYVLYNAHTLHSDTALFPHSVETPLHIQFMNPIYNSQATLGGGVDMSEGRYGMVLFPQGLEYSAIDYDLGAAYITTATPHFNACYEFIKFVSERPDVYTSIPARTSVLNGDVMRQLESAETLALYNSVHERMRQPNVIEFPFAGSYDSVVYVRGFVSVWLLRAMTRYLFEDANLEEELLAAEEFTRAYLECIAPIAPYDPTTQSSEAYINLYRSCFRAVDPTI